MFFIFSKCLFIYLFAHKGLNHQKSYHRCSSVAVPLRKNDNILFFFRLDSISFDFVLQ